MKKQNNQNRVIQAVTVGCVGLLACLCIGAGLYFRYMEKTEAKRAQTEEKTESVVKEAGAVMGETNMAERLLNRPALSAKPGDKREVIHIVEVIPHEACSIFPYLIDWGSKEEYDKNTPLGYEGILYAAARGGFQGQQFGDRGMYSYIKGGETADTLKNYNVSFATENDVSAVDWWRVAKPDDRPITNAVGYFEFVGNKKGLYSINLDKLVKEGEDENGIRYRVMPMQRSGNENKKGEWEVKTPQYYWGKDYASEAYPRGNDGDIKSRTAFNYDLQFTADASSPNANYRVKSVKTNTGVRAAKTAGFAYEAYWADTDTDWDGGFDYSEKGNYKVDSYTSIRVNNNIDRNGKYIRVLNDAKSDGTQGVEAGYFRLYSEAADKDTVKNGDTIYEVNFSHTKVREGSYILNPATVQGNIDANLTGAVEKIFFEYAGDGLGIHDVVFIYAPNGKYAAEVMNVSDGEGRYALTSTEADEESLYEYSGKGKGDYSKVVTKIDCLGIDYDTDNAGWYGKGAQPVGVCIGRTEADSTVEMGDWVFHTVSEAEVNGVTKIEELENGSVPSNKKIYVYEQNRKHCYYARNSFKNNEWFKLLIYLGEEKGLAADAYANGKTGAEVLDMYRAELEAFNKSYRIEIIQRTPDALTVDEVNNADLIYMSAAVGIDGFAQQSVYDEINSYIGNKLPPYENFDANSGRFRFTADFSDEVVKALYENCLYHEEGKTATTAFLADIPALREGVDESALEYPTKNNFGKVNYLLDLFDDPADFAEFIGGYPENDAHSNNGDNYSTVLWGEDNKIRVYPYEYHDKSIYRYNLQEDTIPFWTYLDETIESQWKIDHFALYPIIGSGADKQIGNTQENGDFANFMGAGSIYNQPVGDGWTYWAPDPIRAQFLDAGNMHNIWLIMHNKTSKKQSAPKVIVKNYDYMQVPEGNIVAADYFIYVDEYEAVSPDAFDIIYWVDWTPEEIAEPTPLGSLMIKRMGEAAVLQEEAPPVSYETEYTCKKIRADFADAEGKLNGRKMMDYEITATDEKGKSDTAVVHVIIREAFMLN